jgi:hypothetical protein
MPNNFCGTPKCFRGAKTKIRVAKKINPGGVENVSKHRIYFPGTNKKNSAYKKKIRAQKMFPRKKDISTDKYLRSWNTSPLGQA